MWVEVATSSRQEWVNLASVDKLGVRVTSPSTTYYVAAYIEDGFEPVSPTFATEAEADEALQNLLNRMVTIQ